MAKTKKKLKKQLDEMNILMELIDLFNIKNDIKIIFQILIYKKLLKLV